METKGAADAGIYNKKQTWKTDGHKYSVEGKEWGRQYQEDAL